MKKKITNYTELKTLDYHNSPSDAVEEIAYNHLLSIGINCTVLSEAKKGFLLLTNNFEKQI